VVAAASTAVRAALNGPPRPGRVLALVRSAAYLGFQPVGPDRDPSVLALLGPPAVRLPIGVLLGSAQAAGLARLRVGDPVLVGGGRLQLDRWSLRPARWWDPTLPLVGPTARTAVDRLAAGLPCLPDSLALPTERFAAALQAVASPAAGADELAAATAGLAGLGPGLTPAGDDVLVGALAASYSTGSAALHQSLTAAVRSVTGCSGSTRSGPPARTTDLSAALLHQACAGAGLPQLQAALHAVGRGTGIEPATATLADVGGTSGAAIGHGLLLGLRAVAAGSDRQAA
jgi:Protein of unknown function (DUF2877)